MSASGTFVLESTKNYDAWLTAVGAPAELVARAVAAKPTLEVTKSATGVSVKTTSGDKVFTNALTFGQDSPTDVAGIKYILNVTPTANGYKGTVSFANGKSGTVVVEDTATGFTQTTTNEGVTGIKTYKKV